MYLRLVSFSIACSLTLGLEKFDEKFNTQYNNNLIYPLVDIPTNLDQKFKEDNIFYTMSEDDRIELCNDAKDFAGLDIGATITKAPLKYLESSEKILVECKTIPISYLHKWAWPKGIFVVMEENEFFEYPFEVQITESEPINTRNKRLYDNRLSQLTEKEAMKLCSAAKQHLRKLADDNNNNVRKVPALQSDRIEPADTFDFGNEIGDHVALHCPSTPSMYVYFKNPKATPTPDKDLIQIVLVQN